VFERFYRGRGIRRFEGAGLGLYICQAIVAAHGGRIWADSSGVDQGSTFGFALPLEPD
jgi:signal transduction histidine kinase